MPKIFNVPMYNTAADLARLTGMCRTTIVAKIKKGCIPAYKKVGARRAHWHIQKCALEKNFIKRLKQERPYEKYSKTYTDAEIYIIKNNEHLTNAELAKMLKRNKNSVAIKRCRLRKAGLR